ncbi:carboxylesterase/lipase family protein [Amycolatopsis alkalitolerans]|uniref:Carboxylic ester hydrolase n=1 Tax=Amycolatopsis alkalitolerans TaxID=2547244 RepID=A0A5C4LUS1_9PSEU|nr:carboxylesterase family protein [Amycolatopsis alkalitolerans]TNC22196.1 carboxylesterase family protein [Amycolatopsis alkalitolerans]
MVKTSSGELRGLVTASGPAVFRGVPYARADRFAPPEPVPPWSGVRDATEHGPMSPQPPFRIGAVMGEPPAGLPQGEDCLNLTIVTPAADGRKRPVLVWLPGGAYVTGAGSLDFYDGQRLVTEGDVVFVGVNYRLGALGYLKLDGLSPGNLGLLDQVAALRWVRDNIAAFGGDPDQVTVFGQSAGAHSIACLMAAPAADGLFRRAILQSAPMAMKIAKPARAERIARLFLAALGTDPRTASIEEILAAQEKALARAAGPGGLYSVPQFCPVAETDPLPPLAGWQPAAVRQSREVDLIIGTVRHETNAFLNGKPGITQIEALPFGPAVAAAAKNAITRWMFDAPSRRFADALAAAGGRVFTYRFDWSAPASGYGACHCVELPFLLGDRESWIGAPMLAGAGWDDLAELGRRLRGAWLSFAKTGDPSLGWQRHSPRGRPGYVWARSGPDRALAQAGSPE